MTKIKTLCLQIFILSIPTSVILFVVAVLNPVHHQSQYDYETTTLPWYGFFGLVVIAVLLLSLIGSMWITMVRRFSPRPISRFLFGALTLLLLGSGIGIILDLILYAWVMSSQPDIITGEPLAHGPKRDAWLAQRHPQTNISIDARQAHYHQH